MSVIAKMGRGLFGAAVLCALGLGANQALAAAPAPEARLSCSAFQCHSKCVLAGYHWGECNQYGQCECWYRPA